MNFRAILPQRELHASMVLGRRYTGDQAKAAGIVEETCPISQLQRVALAAAERLAGRDGLDRRTLSVLKQDLYRDAVKALSEPMRVYSLL